jgi:tetratricopeptide (TPR) repeat protein
MQNLFWKKVNFEQVSRFARCGKSLKTGAMSRPRLITLLLAFTTLLVFLPVGQFGFLNYDDNDYVTNNDFVQHGLTGTDIRWAFTAFHAGNWHPLTWLSHMLDCQLFGLNAGAHHFVNVLFHGLNVALLFVWLMRLTGRLGPSAFIAALFAWHPLHVESVAWIAERKDVLSTFFALLALLSYTRYVQENCRRSFWLALLFFALGLMAKPMLVTLPFVLLLLDFWPLGRLAEGKTAPVKRNRFGKLLWEKWPFFLLTGASCVVTFFAQRSGEAVVSLANVPLRYRLENVPVAVVGYLQKLFGPTGLCAIYPMPSSIPAWEVALAVTILILISAVAWHWRVVRPYFLMGWLWFLGTLIPVIGLVQVGGQAMADRYTYIPSIGFFIAVVFLLADVAERIQTPRIIEAGVAVVISVACILVTEHQLQFWRDSETLFRRALAVTRNNDIALVNLGVALDDQKRYDESLAVYRQAEKLENGRYQLHNNLGNVLDKLGRPVESLAEYREASRLRPNDAFLHNSIGIELATLGKYDAALQELDEAGRLDPHYPWSHMERAKIFFKLGRDREGQEELRTAVGIDPDDYQILASTAHYLAANENPAARDGKMAVSLAAKANELSGNTQPMVFDVLGMALAESGDYTNAQVCAQNALDLATAAGMKNTDQIRERLELYQKHQPWHESFQGTNLPVRN